LTIIEYKGKDIKCNIIIARFLVLCLNQFLAYDEFTGNQGLYKLFKDQLNKCLGSLRESLDEMYVKYKYNIELIVNYGMLISEICEVYFYSIILNIDQGVDVISILNKIPYDIINNNIKSTSTSINKAFDYLIYYNSKHNYKFFYMIKTQKVIYLEPCIMSIYFSYFRKCAFDSPSENGNLKENTVQQGNIVKIIFKDLIDIMLFEKEELFEYIKWYGVYIEDGKCVFSKQRKEEESMMRKCRNDLFIEKLRKGVKRREKCLDGIDLDELIQYVKSKDKVYNKEDSCDRYIDNTSIIIKDSSDEVVINKKIDEDNDKVKLNKLLMRISYFNFISFIFKFIKHISILLYIYFLKIYFFKNIFEFNTGIDTLAALGPI